VQLEVTQHVSVWNFAQDEGNVSGQYDSRQILDHRKIFWSAG